jgi:hypothetical protein
VNKVEVGGEIHPLQPDEIKFTYPKINGPSLVKYLFDIANAKNVTMEREFVTYLREAKSLIDTVGEDKALFLVKQAARVTENHFSFNLVRRLADGERQTKTSGVKVKPGNGRQNRKKIS